MFGALISNLEPILRLGQPYYEYQASKDLLHKKLVLDKFRCTQGEAEPRRSGPYAENSTSGI